MVTENTKEISLCIYKDTVNHQYNGDDNLMLITVPFDFADDYAKEIGYEDADDMAANCIADELDGLYDDVVEKGISFTLSDM